MDNSDIVFAPFRGVDTEVIEKLREEAKRLRRLLWVAAHQAGGRLELDLTMIKLIPDTYTLTTWQEAGRLVVKATKGNGS